MTPLAFYLLIVAVALTAFNIGYAVARHRFKFRPCEHGTYVLCARSMKGVYVTPDHEVRTVHGELLINETDEGPTESRSGQTVRI